MFWVCNFRLKYVSFCEELSEILSRMHVSLHVKYPLFLSNFIYTWIFGHIFEKCSNIKCHEHRSNGTRDGGQRDGRTDRYDEANSRFSQCWRNAYKGSWYTVTKRKLLEKAHGVHYVELHYIISRHSFACYEGWFTYVNYALPRLLCVSITVSLFLIVDISNI